MIGRVAAVAAGVALAAIAAPATEVSAHPIDELLQQVYVSPGSGSVQIDVEFTAGEAVAADFLALVDTDGDGLIDESETEAFTQEVVGHIQVELDGESVVAAVVSTDVPAVSLIAAGGGTLRTELVAEPADGTVDTLLVADSYTPLDGSGQPITASAQINLTTDIDSGVSIGSLSRSEEGRSLEAMVETSAEASGDAPTAPLATAGLAIGGLAAAGVSFVLVRRRRRVRPAAPIEVAGGAVAVERAHVAALEEVGS